MEYWAMILLALLAILAVDCLFVFLASNIFKEHRIPYSTPRPISIQLIQTFLFPKRMFDIVKFIYDTDDNAKYIGIYNLRKPFLMLRDLDVIKSVTVKHFEHFEDHFLFGNEVADPLFANHLISLRGDKWRKVRSLMSPTFTSSKMKAMYQLMSEVSVNFSKYLANLPPEKRVMEMKEIFLRFGTDIIATCAFGVEVDSMRNPQNEFYIYGKRATNFSLLDTLQFMISQNLPKVGRILNRILANRDTYKFFSNLVTDTIRVREEKGITRPDMIQIMMEGRNKEYGNELTIKEMTSQAFAFFLGGFDTSATVMSLITYELALLPDVQERLWKEIEGVIEETKGQPTYEAINKMTYLNAVVNEILRIYPPTPLMDRLCVKDFELPPALPDSKPFLVKKGMVVWLPFSAIQRDAKYFAEPEKFKPERFLDENQEGPHNQEAFVPFGIGPRMCIGNRFALLQVKVMLFHFLAQCEVKPCEKTAIPLQFKKGTFVVASETGIWLNVVPREK